MSQAKCKTFLLDQKVSQPTVLMTKINENNQTQEKIGSDYVIKEKKLVDNAIYIHLLTIVTLRKKHLVILLQSRLMLKKI